MIQFALISFLVGAVFGLRFKVMVLLPLSVVGGTAAGVIALVVTQSVASAAVGLVIYVLTLQAGYLLGSMSRFTIAAARAGRPAESSVRAKAAH
jgi:hypothetical protein